MKLSPLFRSFFVFATLLFLVSCGKGCVRGCVSKVTEKTVSVSKDALTGIEEGIKEGRKSTESPDKAKTVTNYEELSALVHVEIFSIRPYANHPGFAEVTFAFENIHSSPVRIAGITHHKSLLALDPENFVIELSKEDNPGSDITVPQKSKIKTSFVFEGAPEKIAKIRLWEHEFEAKK